MFVGKSVFAQLLDYLPLKVFRRCVARYNGDSHIRTFSCLDQFLCLVFAQLTYRESLRDIEACLRSQPAKLYHIGIRGTVARNTLSYANRVRDWRISASLLRCHGSKPCHSELARQIQKGLAVGLCPAEKPFFPACRGAASQVKPPLRSGENGFGGGKGKSQGGKTMKLVIFGSRWIEDMRAVEMAMAACGVASKLAEIVSGGARSVDRLGDRYARQSIHMRTGYHVFMRDCR